MAIGEPDDSYAEVHAMSDGTSIAYEPSRETAAEWIKALMSAHGLNAAQLAKKAGVSPSTITRALDPKVRFTPSARTMARIGAAVGHTPPTWNIMEPHAQMAHRGEVQLSAGRRVPILGEVRAGAWLEIPEEPRPTEWVTVDDEDYPGVRLFALQVVGTSMDKEYPEGTTVIVAETIGASVFDGDVVVVRRHRGSLVETTLKEIEAAAPGRYILWPRSNDPLHQDPIIIDRSSDAQDGPEIIGVVVASYEKRQRKSRLLIDFE